MTPRRVLPSQTPPSDTGSKPPLPTPLSRTPPKTSSVAIMLGVVMATSWLQLAKDDVAQSLLLTLVSLAYIRAAPVGAYTAIPHEALPLAAAITIFYDRTFSVARHGRRVLLLVCSLIAIHYRCGPSCLWRGHTFTLLACLGAHADASLRKNMLMFAVLVWWLAVGSTVTTVSVHGTLAPVVLASTQFFRRPAALKHALRNVRQAHGPAYVCVLARSFVVQPTLLGAIAAASSLYAATIVRPDNKWAQPYLPCALTLGDSSSRKRMHGLLMMVSVVASAVRTLL